MDEKFASKVLSLARIWWFGPLSGAVIAVGFTNIVGVCLTLLYYLSNLEKISLNLILVLFSVSMLLFANMTLMLGAVKNKQQFLIPWLAITAIAILVAVVYCVIQWDSLTQFRVPLVAAMVLSIYFLAVVSSYYHELAAPAQLSKLKEKAAVAPVVAVGDKEAAAGAEAEEETVLVALEQEDSPPPRHPRPDEVITITEGPLESSKMNTNNPFMSDVFASDKDKSDLPNTIGNSKQVKGNPEINLKANFTPFKKSSKVGDKTPAKMKVFLPGSGGDESDFDFSFTDPDFDSSLCAETHEGVLPE